MRRVRRANKPQQAIEEKIVHCNMYSPQIHLPRGRDEVVVFVTLLVRTWQYGPGVRRID